MCQIATPNQEITSPLSHENLIKTLLKSKQLSFANQYAKTGQAAIK